jgi:hypothetical protein
LLPRRAPHRRVDHHDGAGAPQPSGKFNILHQGDGSEAAHSREMNAFNENGLVAVDGAERAAMPALQSFQCAQESMSLVELSIKSAADNGWISHG